MTLETDAELRKAAERRVNAKLGFRSHLIVYLLVNLGLLGINLATSPDYLWCVWPAGGWGIGLLAHGMSVYGSAPGGRERMIEAEMRRMRERR